jgi:hypothetical protein
MEYAKEIFIGHGYDKIRGIHYFQGVDDLYSAVLVVQQIFNHGRRRRDRHYV